MAELETNVTTETAPEVENKETETTPEVTESAEMAKLKAEMAKLKAANDKLSKENAEKTGGSFSLESEEGKGTKLTASLDTNNIDCLPLGDLSGTLLSLMLTNPLSPDFLFEGTTPKGSCSFDTREVRAALGSDIPFNEPSVAQWLKEALEEEMNPIFGGVLI